MRPKPGTFMLQKRLFGELDADAAPVAAAPAASSSFVRPPGGSFRLPEREFRAR